MINGDFLPTCSAPFCQALPLTPASQNQTALLTDSQGLFNPVLPCKLFALAFSLPGFCLPAASLLAGKHSLKPSTCHHRLFSCTAPEGLLCFSDRVYQTCWLAPAPSVGNMSSLRVWAGLIICCILCVVGASAYHQFICPQ